MKTLVIILLVILLCDLSLRGYYYFNRIEKKANRLLAIAKKDRENRWEEKMSQSNQVAKKDNTKPSTFAFWVTSTFFSLTIIFYIFDNTRLWPSFFLVITFACLIVSLLIKHHEDKIIKYCKTLDKKTK